MTVGEALREGAGILGAAREASGTPLLDASLLLAACLGTTRTRLLADQGRELGEAGAAAPRGAAPAVADQAPAAPGAAPSPLDRYRSLVARRAAGEPVAYLLGVKEFYGREFLVDPRVLIPRPDTELLVEAALAAGDEILAERAAAGGAGSGASLPGAGVEAAPRSAAGAPLPAEAKPLRVHEVCVGSGAVAVSLACERPAWRVSASDLSEEALAVARANAAALVDTARPGGPLGLCRADLLEGLEGPFDLVLANPPYVPSLETDALLAKGWGEPRMALDGGADGLDLVRRLVPAAFAVLAPGGRLLLEADPGQAAEIADLLGSAGFDRLTCLEDLAGLARVSGGRKP